MYVLLMADAQNGKGMTISIPINLRVSKEWNRRASNALNVLGRPLALDRSGLIRLAVDQEEILFCHSPYVALSARHFVFASGSGDIHYWAEEELRLLEQRHLLPFEIRLKPPARRRFLESATNLEEVRSRWLVNYFSARDKGRPEGDIRSDDVDELGISEKAVDLRIERGQGVPLIRERLCVVRDFVREEEAGDTSPENASIPIEIPTIDLRIYVLVDRSLYQHEPQLYSSARVGCDFRNLDSGRFQRHTLGFGDNQTSFYGEIFPESEADHEDSLYRDTVTRVQDVAEEYLRRLHRISSPGAKTMAGTVIIGDESVRTQLHGLSLPSDYLFGEFRWAKPYLGTVVNVTWNRPSKLKRTS